jgi:hypothetical protein
MIEDYICRKGLAMLNPYTTRNHTEYLFVSILYICRKGLAMLNPYTTRNHTENSNEITKKSIPLLFVQCIGSICVFQN